MPINQFVSTSIFNNLLAFNRIRWKKIILTALSDSIKKSIFAKLFDESVDFLEE